MKLAILSEEWEKDAPARQAAIDEMKKHPFTLDELIEQQRRNDHIRQKEFLRSKNKIK